LLIANSLTTTSGTLVTIVGGGIGLGVRQFAGSGDGGSAVIALCACVVYLAAAAVATRMPASLLGPDVLSDEPLGRALSAVARGVAAGARHVGERRHALRALVAMSATRLLFGISTIGTLLLYRNYFHDQGVLRAGLVGLAQAFAVAAVGYVVAAIVTPVITARTGKPRWMVEVFALAAADTIGFGLPFAMLPLLVGAFVLGFTAQSAKICVDTIVQEDIADDFRGRVFSFYDTLFNLTFVCAAVIAAFTLPASGRSYPMVIGMSAGYAVIAAWYAAAERVPVRERGAAAAGAAT
jgi:hypothetical protein